MSQISVEALKQLREYLPPQIPCLGWQNVKRNTARLVIANVITVTYHPSSNYYQVQGNYSVLRTPHINVVISTVIALVVESNYK